MAGRAKALELVAIDGFPEKLSIAVVRGHMINVLGGRTADRAMGMRRAPCEGDFSPARGPVRFSAALCMRVASGPVRHEQVTERVGAENATSHDLDTVPIVVFRQSAGFSRGGEPCKPSGPRASDL